MEDADKFYKPEIRENILVDGIAAETIPDGAKGKIIQKGFITSLQTDFAKIANSLLSPFLIQPISSVNKLLVIIKKDNCAKIYSDFPLTALTRGKRDIKKEELVTKEDIFDMDKIEFRDSKYEIDIEEGDKIIFLFRIDWKFGLFFDFTKKINLESLKKELGYLYKRLFYYDLYSFVENKKYSDNLVKDGWFPFIRLICRNFDEIMQYYKEDRKHDFQINNLISRFTKEKIESFTQYWWRKKLFKDRKEIIEAGIDSFLQNDKNGFITCLHTLYPQIEGIMGLDYFATHNRKPNFEELLEHIKQKAKIKFNAISSTGFPNEFYEYLKKTVFENFDLTSGKVDLSRHTTSHGYANVQDFNKAKALQSILILDQIYFYL